MRIIVQLKPGSREAKIEKIDEGNYRVWVKPKPVRGQANAAMVELLADYFNVAKSALHIVIGRTAREKLVQIDR